MHSPDSIHNECALLYMLLVYLLDVGPNQTIEKFPTLLYLFCYSLALCYAATDIYMFCISVQIICICLLTEWTDSMFAVLCIRIQITCK